MTKVSQLTRGQVVALAIPIMLANALGIVVGFVDSTLIGRTGSQIDLAGIGLGVTIYGIFYWGFGFLRMSTAGLAAQAKGADDAFAIQAHLARAIPLGMVIGAVLLALQGPLLSGLLSLYQSDAVVEGTAKTYLGIRLFGLPATLASIALMGWFIGIARPGRALIMQLGLNGVNAVLSIWFVLGLGHGVAGVATASVFAEWAGFALGLVLAVRHIRKHGGIKPGLLVPHTLLDLPSLKALGGINTNIFIRTITLTIGFQFFMWATAKEDPAFIAGNHILLQIITFMALVLDAFAHVAETEVGQAYGAKSKQRFDRAVRLTTEFSGTMAVGLSLLIWLGGGFVIDLVTDLPEVRETARIYLPWCAAVPLLGFLAWQLDGVFIGATRTAEMRNAGIAALLIYLGLHFAAEPYMGRHGIWFAFLMYYIARGATLAFYFPALRRRLNGDPSPQPPPPI